MKTQGIQAADATQAEWWLGMADAATIGAAHTAAIVERVHIAIADETFQVLSAVPVVRNVSQRVRSAHHGISRFCYRGVGLASVAMNHMIALISPRSA
ncbi:MAG: hypothetical protein AAF446_06285 [Pseudomonadota bacterium]